MRVECTFFISIKFINGTIAERSGASTFHYDSGQDPGLNPGKVWQTEV